MQTNKKRKFSITKRERVSDLTEIGLYEYIMFGAVLLAAIVGMFQMFRKKVPMYFMLYICGVWCFAIRLIYIGLIDLCGEVYNEASSLGFLGIGGMFAFFASANYGTFNSLIDDRGKKIHLIRTVAALNAVFVIGLIAFEMMYADTLTPFNIITLVISLFPVPFCVYFCTKLLLMKSNGDNLLIGVKPLNLSTLLICFGILLYNYFNITGNQLGMDITFGIYSICIVAEVFLADWGRKKWQS